MREFIDIVADGLTLVKQRDDNAWSLGDLVVEAVEDLGMTLKPGNKVADDTTPTLSDLASAWDTEAPRMSEWYHVAVFYPSDKRTIDLSWSHYNRARTAVKNRPEDQQLDDALELLETAVHLKLSVTAFKRYVNGEYFEGYVERHELSPRLQGMIPASTLGVWMTMKRMQEG